jgi:Holliday junction resolvasome RuvABC endonuclease subunit
VLASRKLTLVGMDPSLRNWGLARASWDIVTGDLQVMLLKLSNPVLHTGKQVRQNSIDQQAAQQLYENAAAFMAGAHATFVEVPVGSQSARAMASYGICVGVLGALRANGLQYLEVTASEVKLAGHGTKTASKDDMIAWASRIHPDAPWLRYQHDCKGKPSKTNPSVTVSAYTKGQLTSDNEHLADAVAAIHAGLRLNTFKQMLPFLGVAA